MTYDKFKCELYQIRENQTQVIQLLEAINALDKHKFDNLVQVTDPGRERIQKTKSFDDPVIDAMQKYEAKRKRLSEKIRRLNQDRDDIQDKIFKMEGATGAIMLSFFVFGAKINDIADNSHYSVRQVYRIIDKGIEDLYQYYADAV